eukprot:symbB.v1.2.030847.t1/scaffold3516.1/size54992/2
MDTVRQDVQQEEEAIVVPPCRLDHEHYTKKLDLLQTYLIKKPDQFLALFPAEDTGAEGEDTKFRTEDVNLEDI